MLKKKKKIAEEKKHLEEHVERRYALCMAGLCECMHGVQKFCEFLLIFKIGYMLKTIERTQPHTTHDFIFIYSATKWNGARLLFVSVRVCNVYRKYCVFVCVWVLRVFFYWLFFWGGGRGSLRIDEWVIKPWQHFNLLRKLECSCICVLYECSGFCLLLIERYHIYYWVQKTKIVDSIELIFLNRTEFALCNNREMWTNIRWLNGINFDWNAF